MLQEQDSPIFVGRGFYYVKREAMYEFKSTKKINLLQQIMSLL